MFPRISDFQMKDHSVHSDDNIILCSIKTTKINKLK